MTKIFRNSEESGRSMVEMLGVLAIVGVLSIGGIAGYSKAMAKYKINKTLDQVSMIITNVRTTFGNQSSYRGLTTANAISYELIGTDLTLGSSTKLTNAFNGDVQITGASATGGTCSGTGMDDYCPTFVVSYTGLDKNACGVVASSDWGGTASSGLIAIKISDAASGASAETTLEYSNTDKTHTWSGTSAAQRLPIDYSEAMSECSDSLSTVSWLYN